MNILTFDIEDWFHINFDKTFNNSNSWANYESRIEYNTNTILEILDRKEIKATFFCLGWVARKYPHIIKEIYSNGHDIGSHSDIHNLVSLQSPAEFDADLNRSLGSIESVTGDKVRIFRAPAFSINSFNSWAFEILIKYGIDIDCSTFPAKHEFGGSPEMFQKDPFFIEVGDKLIKEFPMSTHQLLGKSIVVSGGGYFRFFPYWIIQKLIESSNYNMTYFHPRDFDPMQPLLDNLSMIRRIKSYTGLKQSLTKFKRLLNDFSFVSITEADRIYNWSNSNIVKLNSL